MLSFLLVRHLQSIEKLKLCFIHTLSEFSEVIIRGIFLFQSLVPVNLCHSFRPSILTRNAVVGPADLYFQESAAVPGLAPSNTPIPR